MIRMRRRRCRHCNELFVPDARNRTRQRYCSKAECRKASKEIAMGNDVQGRQAPPF